ncbi:MAG: energy transducer TonB [Nonlabens sp.]|nr:energy transducer TonB [Nonlabens sp.]
MKNQTTQLAAATASASKLFDKKKANLKSNSSINFQIGLIAALLFAWAILEVSTEQVHQEPVVITTTSRVFEVEPLGKIKILPNVQPEVIEATIPEPAKPKVSLAPPKLVNNNTVVATPEPVSSLPVVTTAVTVATVATSSTQPTTTASQPATAPATPTTMTMGNASEAPLFPGCSTKMNNKERIDCFNEKIQRFVLRNFDTSIADRLDTEQVKFTVVFTLDTRGEVVDVMVKSKIAAIEQEAKRLMNKLPDMTPGKYDNKAINVQYALPIVFNIR